MGMVNDLIRGHEKIVELLGQIAEEADTKKSRATTNLVDDLNEEHGKFIWMLRSFNG
jgi:DNA-binding ferritin-like protein